MYHNILVAIENSEADRTVLEHVQQLARLCGSSLLLVHVADGWVARHYDEGQRMVLAELLWRIVYADGKLSQREATLARKLGYLLDLPPGYLADARKKATGSA